MCDLYFQFWLTKRNKLCTESEKTLQRRKSLEVIPALTCVTLLTMSLGSNIYKVHFKHALTSSDLSFSWKDVLSKSTRFAGIRQVKTRFQMLYFTEAVETAPRNITQTKKTPIRSIALAIMTEKPKKLELRTLSCVWNPKEVIWPLQRTNNLPVWGGVNTRRSILWWPGAGKVQGTVGVLFSLFSTRCQQNVER